MPRLSRADGRTLMNPPHHELRDACLRIQTVLQEQQTFGADLESAMHPLSFEERISNQIESENEFLRPRLRAEFLGAGPLECLLFNEGITEILINSPTDIWIECEGQWQQCLDVFHTEFTYCHFFHRICRESGILTNLDHPTGEGQWHNFRVSVIQRPLVQVEYQLSLRRHRCETWTLQELADTGWASQPQIDCLKELLVQRKSLLVIGPTGSGKTTVLRALLEEIDSKQRVVIVQDTDELKPANSLSTSFLTRWDCQGHLKEIALSDLIRTALRFRPDRMVVGEVRGPEAKDLLMALATGHQGSLATLHGKDAAQALLRLEMLVQLGAPQWSITAVRQLIQLSVDAIVVVGFVGNTRKLNGIWRLASLESFGFTLESL